MLYAITGLFVAVWYFRSARSAEKNRLFWMLIGFFLVAFASVGCVLVLNTYAISAMLSQRPFLLAWVFQIIIFGVSVGVAFFVRRKFLKPKSSQQ
ncbi:hypothetical protein [Paraherbaspirillum soli]|uniref:Uncharacterized protein n=1 Tax=Paraherbaspirillum soli TaxID=631222 RepID=A0ABW0M7V0_9BURK